MKRTIVSWSSGKDSAFALHEIRKTGEYEIVELLTTVNETHSRVAMHGLREELLDRQAAALGLPVVKIRIPWPCPNELYEAKIAEYWRMKKAEGVTHSVFGDLFLEDIRKYRDANLTKAGLEGVYPLWRKDTRRLAEQMIDSGQKALLVCVDPKMIDSRFAGRQFDRALLAELPKTADPCGENGEFHTFVYDSPVFRAPIAIRAGETVSRSGFVYADVLPA